MAVVFESRIGRLVESPRILGLPEPWFHLALGLVIAPVFSLTPLLSLIGWYLAALIHEMGHTAVAWLMGVPAIPALGITAEAATMHGEQLLLLALGIWAGLGFLAWRVERPAARWTFLGIVLVFYPLLAFTDLREVLHHLGGHLGELAIGGVFLARALSGGFSESQVERGLYSTLGWFLIGTNLFLTLGLVGSSAARAEYASNGSYGMANDYVRLANYLSWSLEGVAMLMTVVALVVAPAVVGGWWARCATRDE